MSGLYASVCCFGVLEQNGYGCCYNIREHDLIFAVSAAAPCKETSAAAFIDALKDSLQDMHDVAVA